MIIITKKLEKIRKPKEKTRSKRGGSAPIERNVNEGKWLIRNNRDSINYWRNNILPTLNADDDEIQTTTNAMNFFITELEYFDDMGDEEREETMGEDYDRTWNYVELDNGTILFGHTHEIEQSDALEDMQLGPDTEIVDI